MRKQKEKLSFSAGDILIDRQSLRKYPIVEAYPDSIYLDLGNRQIKRAIGQVMKHRKRFIILRKGQVLEKELAFYCPVKNKMIILEAGTVFMGEV
jgi:hypothetical protein